MVRIKNRYIAVQVMPYMPKQTLHLNDNTLTKCILQNIHKYYGDYGLGISEHGFRVKYCNDETKIAIIRCSHRSHLFVAHTIPFITVIGEVRAKFRTLYTGATIMQCNKFIIKHQRQFLDRMLGQIISAKERQNFIQKVMEFDLD